jgi:heme exporter protein D
VASSLYEHAGWLAIAAVGSALSLVALIVFSVVSRRARIGAMLKMNNG